MVVAKFAFGDLLKKRKKKEHTQCGVWGRLLAGGLSHTPCNV